jgi:hypothetical protein
MSNNNEVKVEGSHNIVIQDIKDSTITLNVNGDLTEVKNDLSAVKEILEKFHANTFQSGKDTYNINQLDSANFGFITGKKTFNQFLTSQLIQALKPHRAAAGKFLEKVSNIPNWEEKKEITNKAKEIIAYSFVGVIGIQLRKIMAIGEESFSEQKQRNYIENCIITAKRSLELVCFTLLSKLWDHQRQNFIALNKEHNEVITHFFNDAFEGDILQTLKLLRTLVDVFDEHKLEYPLQELKTAKDLLVEDGDFAKACEQMHDINKLLDTETFTSIDCYEAEKQLTTILEGLVFLALYRMVSIKAIKYEEMRNSKSYYLHTISTLGISVKSELNPEGINYTEEPINTDAILLFQGNYRQSINLFPFVIDLNALTMEGGVKICFYSSRKLEDDSLNYRFLDNNKIENIVYKHIHKSIKDPDEQKERLALNELMKDKSKHIDYKLDSVFTMFQEASSAILGNTQVDFSDIDDDEPEF